MEEHNIKAKDSIRQLHFLRLSIEIKSMSNDLNKMIDSLDAKASASEKRIVDQVIDKMAKFLFTKGLDLKCQK